MKFGYLVEVKNRALSRTDLFEVWPKTNCRRCYGTGRDGQILVGHKKHGRDEPAVVNLCECLRKQEEKVKRG